MWNEFFEYYNRGREKNRFQRCMIEFERTKEILGRYINSDSEVLDMGGGAGYYSFWLSEKGCKVHLRDIVPLHIEQAREKEIEENMRLESIEIGDATSIDASNGFFDHVLLMGPLYHLQKREDRRKALLEASRVLKKDGKLFIAIIPRTASYVDGFHQDMFSNELFTETVEKTIESGMYNDKITGKFTNAYFFRANEFKNEINAAGLECEKIINIEGVYKVINDYDEKFKDEKFFNFYMEMTKKVEEDESLFGFSNHLMAVVKKNKYKAMVDR